MAIARVEATAGSGTSSSPGSGRFRSSLVAPQRGILRLAMTATAAARPAAADAATARARFRTDMAIPIGDRCQVKVTQPAAFVGGSRLAT